MKGLIFFVIAFFSMISSCFAYEGFGICNFGKQTIPSVICYGPTVLDETTISGEIKVAGPVKAHNITANSVIVTGSVYFEDSKILGQTEITGHLSTKNAEFQNNLTIISDNVLLDHTAVNGNVTVNSENSTPSLTLQCGTVISGNVNFSGIAGMIQITADSVIKGSITNGKTQLIKADC